MLEHPYNAHAQPAQPQPWGVGRQLAVPSYPLRPAVGDAHVIVAWVVAVLTLGYMLPWAIAATRRRSNSGAIGALNFLAGWTFVGWIVALVMACGSESAAMPLQINITKVAQVGGPPPGWYPDAAGNPQYWDGARWIDRSPPPPYRGPEPGELA